MPTLIYVVRVQLRDKLSASNNEVWLRDPQDSTKAMKNICTGHSDTRLICKVKQTPALIRSLMVVSVCGTSQFRSYSACSFRVSHQQFAHSTGGQHQCACMTACRRVMFNTPLSVLGTVISWPPLTRAIKNCFLYHLNQNSLLPILVLWTEVPLWLGWDWEVQTSEICFQTLNAYIYIYKAISHSLSSTSSLGCLALSEYLNTYNSAEILWNYRK